MSSLYAMDVSARPVGSHFGGKHGVSVECPLCRRPALRFKQGRTAGVFWIEYAHRFSIDLDRKNEPRLTASEICRQASDPSAKRSKGSK